MKDMGDIVQSLHPFLGFLVLTAVGVLALVASVLVSEILPLLRDRETSLRTARWLGLAKLGSLFAVVAGLSGAVCTFHDLALPASVGIAAAAGGGAAALACWIGLYRRRCVQLRPETAVR